MEAALVVVCPLCKGPLESAPEACACKACGRRYPVLCGLPDLRVQPDRYLSIEDDRAKGARLAAGASAGRDFAATLDLYWSLTPEVPPDLAARFRAHQLAEEQIAGAVLAELGEVAGPLLDAGCGTGGLVTAAARRGVAAAGVDAAFRWLVAAQVRLREAGLRAPLFCANAEYLPFPDGSFAAVTANDLLEHVADPVRVFGECRRVLRAGGVLYVSTNNRCSALPEPHAGVWGVGWLPRGLQASYVQLMTGRPYRHIRLLSGPELRRLAAGAGFARIRLQAAPLSSPPDRWPLAHALHRRIRRWSAMRWIGPRLQLVCRK